jgi:hypothetical protein
MSAATKIQIAQNLVNSGLLNMSGIQACVNAATLPPNPLPFTRFKSKEGLVFVEVVELASGFAIQVRSRESDSGYCVDFNDMSVRLVDFVREPLEYFFKEKKFNTHFKAVRHKFGSNSPTWCYKYEGPAPLFSLPCSDFIEASYQVWLAQLILAETNDEAV